VSVVRVHHLNCGTLCPLAGGMLDGTGGWLTRGQWVCHCLLLETDAAGLVLIDTGLGTADCADPSRFPAVFRQLAAPRFDRQETALEQIRALGHDPRDVRHLVVTHLDLDHAGGLPDFPWASVHVHAAECYAATRGPTWAERQRYVVAQWAHEPSWQTYDEAGDDWYGFAAVRSLRGLGDEVALVPLHGHTRGHSGVAVRASGDGWILHAGDAYFHHGTLTPHGGEPGRGALATFERLDSFNDRARLANLARLRELHAAYGDEVAIICAHDPVEYARCSSRHEPEDRASRAAPSAR
jgi:glyoxylase-like metal-dependent hydrolase (beta-lactamase superfamily II)